MQSPRIPWEVIERVIGHCGNNPRSLRSFSLACRELLPCSRCVMLAGGVKLRSRDHAFALVDFLHANPHLKPFIGSMTVHLTDFPPFPLLPILSNLSEITFTHNRKSSVDTLPVPSLHPRYLAGFRLFGSRLQTLRLLQVSFTTSLAFVQLLLAFSSITHLVCQGVTIGIEGNQGPLAVAKQRLSEKLRLQSLASDSESLAEFAVPRRHYTAGDVLLDPNFKLASSAVERLEITNKIKTNLSSRLRLSEWSRLQSLTLYRPYGPSEALAPVFGLLNSVDSTTCKDVTIQFDQEPHIVDLMQGLNPRYDRELAQIPLTFSRVTIVWSTRPLRATRNSFWTRELKTHFPMLSQHPNATFVLKSETASFSPDGQLFLVASQGGLEIWEFELGFELPELKGLGRISTGRGVRDAQFSPCGKYIASAGDDCTVFLWRVSDGTCMAKLSEHEESVAHVAFSPDGKTLSSAADDGSVVIRHMRDVIPVELVEHYSTLLDISVGSSSFLLSDSLL